RKSPVLKLGFFCAYYFGTNFVYPRVYGLIAQALFLPFKTHSATMKRILPLLLLVLALPLSAQKQPAFKAGEWLKYRIHYGFLNASYATMHLTSDKLNGIP